MSEKVHVVSKAAARVILQVPGFRQTYELTNDKKGIEIDKDFFDAWVQRNGDSDLHDMLLYPGHRATRRMGAHEYGMQGPGSGGT